MSELRLMCHFRPMTYEVGDSDDTGRYEEWFECSFCGHTKTVSEAMNTQTGSDDAAL